MLSIVDVIPFKYLHHTHVKLAGWYEEQTNKICNRSRNLTEGKSMLWDRFYVDEKHQYVYCSLPKVACSSWTRTLLKLNGKEVGNLRSIHNRQMTDRFVKRAVHYSPARRQVLLNNYYKFVFVREPLERLVSAYRDKIFHKPPEFTNVRREIMQRRSSSKNVHTGETVRL